MAFRLSNRVLGGALVVALAPACGLGEKQAMADRVVASVDALAEQRTATGTLGVTMTVLELPAAAAMLAADQGVDLALPPPTAEVTFPVRLDIGAARAELLDGDAPFQVFDDLDVYGRRQDAAEGDARPWAFVDLGDVDEGEADLDVEQDVPLVVANALNPSVLVDLAAGALTGSIGEVATEEVAGVAATRYDANFDVEKTTDDTREDRYDEDDREALDALLDILTVKGRVHPGSVWVDGDGVLRQVLIRFRTEPELDSVVEVAVRLTIESAGTDVTIEIPDQRDWLEVSTVVGFLRTIVPESVRATAFGVPTPTSPSDAPVPAP